MAAAVDTLKLYQRFRGARIEEDAAKEIAEAINDVIDANLATKNDLARTEATLQASIEKTRAELKADIANAKASTIKWMVGMLLAFLGIVVAVQKLF
jgi:outer membrane protein TolC